jgi:hypothetical protein
MIFGDGVKCQWADHLKRMNKALLANSKPANVF